MDDTKVTKQVVKEVFKNKEFAKCVAEAVGENIIKAIRTIDNWQFEYEIKDVMRSSIFTDEFKEEIKAQTLKYVKDNKKDIHKLISTNINMILTKGIIEFSEKTAELLSKKVSEVKSIY